MVFFLNCVCAEGWGKEWKRNPEPFRGMAAPAMQCQDPQLSEPFDLVMMVWPQHGEGDQYKSWDLSLQFIFSCPSEGRCHSCPCNLLSWAAANWSAQGGKVQLAWGAGPWALAGKLHLLKIWDQVGQDFEQPGLVEDVPVHGRVFSEMHFKVTSSPHQFVILWRNDLVGI